MTMIKRINKIFLTLFTITAMMNCLCSCDDYPVDEDGLLITGRQDCYVGSFELLGEDHHSVIATVKVDTVACEIHAEQMYGTNLKKLWPQFSLATDCKISPKITGWEDFSNIEKPRKWTIISGNRKVKKEYTLYITVQQPD